MLADQAGIGQTGQEPAQLYRPQVLGVLADKQNR
jgi:hypothetical protein